MSALLGVKRTFSPPHRDVPWLSSFFRRQYFLYAHIVNKMRSAYIGQVRSLVTIRYVSANA